MLFPLLLRRVDDLQILFQLRSSRNANIDLIVMSLKSNGGNLALANTLGELSFRTLPDLLSFIGHQITASNNLLEAWIAPNAALVQRHVMSSINGLDQRKLNATIQRQTSMNHRNLITNDMTQRQLLEAGFAQRVDALCFRPKSTGAVPVHEAIVWLEILRLVLVIPTVQENSVRAPNLQAVDGQEHFGTPCAAINEIPVEDILNATGASLRFSMLREDMHQVREMSM
mmetsp:Transcript_24656/g.53713  ORF Transcript_24656/g.53713 Transcript_24656/m.53713 type:complete len:228 (+) Transcript_24656:408-1091(+)